jgi:hypothetical protein
LIPGDITGAPNTVFTDASGNSKNSFKIGDTIYGHIEGGDPDDTWSCLDIPNGSNCTSNNTTYWRQLTKPYDGHPDGWQINPGNGKLELGGFPTDSGFPEGTYKMYTQT